VNNDYPSKIRRALQDRDVVKGKLMITPSLVGLNQIKQTRPVAITTGIHPALKEAKDKITKLSINLRKVEEQSTFWRRKTLDLRKELLSNKKNASHFGEKVEKLEMERIVLQNKVIAAEEQTSTISNAMRSLIAENKEFKETIINIDEELKVLMENGAKSDVQVPHDAQVCIALDKALEDTMTDLSDRLGEIEDLKKLLAQTTIEKNLIEEEVRKKQIIAEIVNINQDELEDKNVNKIERLQEAVEKCMFRIAVLTQKNAELRKMKGGISFTLDQDAKMDVLEDDDKLHILESLCMRRYRKILKEAAEELVAQETKDPFSD